MANKHDIQYEFEAIVRRSQDFIRKYLDNQSSIVITGTDVSICQSVKTQ